jgi:hypothetical protein
MTTRRMRTTIAKPAEDAIIGTVCPHCRYMIRSADDPEDDLINPDNNSMPVECPGCKRISQLEFWNYHMSEEFYEERIREMEDPNSELSNWAAAKEEEDATKKRNKES